MSRPPRPLPPRPLPSRPFFPPPSPRAPASAEALDDLDLVEVEEEISEAAVIDVEVEEELVAAADVEQAEASVIVADQTGEIAIDDILEVNVLTTERLAPVRPLITEPLRVPPSSLAPLAADVAPRVQPSSLAPLALDVAPTSARATLSSLPSWTPPSATSTLQMARAAGIPKLPPRLVVAATSVLGLCLVAALGGAVLGYTRPVAAGSAAGASPSVGQVPRTTVLEPARALVTDPPDTAPGKEASSTDGAPDPEGAPEASNATASPAPVPTVHAAAARAAAAPARPSGPAHARAATGVVHVPGSAAGVLVDGAPHKVSGGSVTVACGKHLVKVPGHSARSVVVPCGGAATF